MIIQRPGRIGSWRTGRDYPNDSTAKNGQIPETSPGDLRRLAVTCCEKLSANTDVKNSKGVNNNVLSYIYIYIYKLVHKNWLDAIITAGIKPKWYYNHEW